MLYVVAKCYNKKNELFVYYQKIENEKIISQIVGSSEACDQNGDNKLPYLHYATRKGLFVKYKKYGTPTINNQILSLKIILLHWKIWFLGGDISKWSEAFVDRKRWLGNTAMISWRKFYLISNR